MSEVKVTALLKEKLNPTYLAVEDVSCEPMSNINQFYTFIGGHARQLLVCIQSNLFKDPLTSILVSVPY